MHLEFTPVWTTQNANVVGPINSAWFPVSQMFGWSAEFYFFQGSNGAGTLTVNTSCAPPNQAPSTLSDVNSTHPPQLANSSLTFSGTDTQGYTVAQANYNWIQFVFTIGTQSAGAYITGRLNAKGF